ncbi:sulfatase [Verrucomicrobiaceae bacterium R5-34]|nr:sulfatase [Verrucomicrobiaceae bacterium R5-34]
MKIKFRKLLILMLAASGVLGAQAEETKPNVLFIALDDLNDWIGCLGGHPQTITPNMDRLAASGVLFTNAHCVAPACNASRSAIFTGQSPHRSGIYSNAQVMRDVLPDATLIPKHFTDHGYWSTGSGKMLHYVTDARSWNDYFPPKETEMPLPKTLYPEKRPVSLPVGGPWQYVETDWGPLETSDKDFGGDYSVTEFVGNYLKKEHDKPFFLACGIYRPHEPWFVPAKYFEKFPLDSIQLPPGYRKDDLDDVPALGKRFAHNRYFDHIQKEKQWKQAVQGYLASIYFADTMLGRVLDALEEGPNKNNTIVVLWSDHGWHLGEKQHWQKYTAWRACTRVPLMVKVPEKLSSKLPKGTTAGTVCEQPVSLLSLYPTLTELCGLPTPDACDAPSIVPQLLDANTSSDPVPTFLEDAASLGVSGKGWRYISYRDGGEELYNIDQDPHEWTNLAKHPEHQAKLKQLKAFVPKTFAPKPKVKVKDLPSMRWKKTSDPTKILKPNADGSNVRLVFVNQSPVNAKIHEVSAEMELTEKALVKAESEVEIKGRPGSVWAITKESGELMGYFKLGDRMAKGVIPKNAAE